jgi:lipopolysaccharide transport system permease protein
MVLLDMVRRIFEITLQLIIKDFKVRYKGTLLGYAWALVTPLVFASIFNFVFQHIIRFEVKDYPLFLVSGLFAWQWFSNSVSGGACCFLQNASLIKKLNFQRYLIPFSVVLIDALHFALALPIILAFLLVWGKPVYYHSWWYGLPLVAVTQLAIIYGATLGISSLNTVFRDIDKVVTLLVTMLFYFTPVFYPLSVVPEDVVRFIQLNPMTGVISAWHGLFLDGSLDWASLAYSMVWAVLLVLLGAFVYQHLNSRFAEVL